MNLKELSQHLGLSKTTVSRALNGFSDVNEETRNRVMEAARRFNYAPNANAQRLATGRTGALGIMFPIAENPFADPLFAEFVAGVADGAVQCRRDLFVSSAFDGEEAAYRRLARSKAVDVMILGALEVEDLRIRLLSHLGLQVVAFGRTASSIPYAYLDIDNESGCRRATKLLIGLGHRDIALINGDTRFTAAEHRHVGWLSAFTKDGLTVPEHLVVTGAATEEAAYRGARRLLAAERRPTAFVCASMYLASGCVRAIRDCGLAVGADISVVAHDDGMAVIRPEAFEPSLTATAASVRGAGLRVAEMAAALADGGEIADLQEVRPVELIFRDSAQPPRRSL
ncbi:LacI family DNA-binding transcriptional regulator [Consotaella salsifontis]|uniref:LacI family transcriptional regulator n=1 Tax=Consotaella salsifontis TaxID=1365950 RepID=A0A1T4S598_9HYPH|nr:substrate-binding domain-containing protein [Consotaella salsifontis]SKA23394.1 LacI family transcriptional regulator [Consotaella salsifontis]